MRTTLRIDEHLMAEAKRLAIATGRTLTAVIEDALRGALGPRRGQPRRKRVRLPTFGGRGVRSGVDLDDTASLLDLMDRGHDPR